MVDSGVDFIWGTHPHVIQNSEVYKNAPIYYSLGNFVFDQYWSEATQTGLVVGLLIEGDEITTTEITVDIINQGEPNIDSANLGTAGLLLPLQKPDDLGVTIEVQPGNY